MEIFQSFDFSGGLNITNGVTEILPAECVLSQNFISDGKKLQVLTGYTKFNRYPIEGYELKPVKSLFRFIKPSNPNVKKFIASIGDTVWVADEVLQQWTPLISGLNENNTLDFAQAGDFYCYMLNRSNGLYKYNGTSSPYSISSAPCGSTISVHYNRLFIAGNPDHPNRFYWSDPGLHDNWDVIENYQELPTIDSDTVTKIIFYNNGSLIFKQQSIWQVEGNIEPFPVYTVSESIGCPAGKSVLSYGNCIFWFGNTGHFYCYDGSAIINLTESKIGKIPVARSMMDKVCASVIDGWLWVSYCDKNTNDIFNNRVLMLDLESPLTDPRWFGVHKGYHIDSFCEFSNQIDSGNIYFGDAVTSTVWLKNKSYYLGYGLCGTTLSGTSSTLTIRCDDSSVTENCLAGCKITLTGGNGAGQERIITSNTEFTENSGLYEGVISVHSNFTTLPQSNTLWEIGLIDARYRTGPLSFGTPEQQKIYDKIFLHTEAQGDFSVKISILKDHLDTGSEYFYSLLGDASYWDNAVWDEHDFSMPDMLDKYIDLDFEFSKYLNLEFSVNRRDLPALIYGFILMFSYGDSLQFK